MTDTLDNKTDAELSEIFAVEVYGAREIEDGMMRLRDVVYNRQSFEDWKKVPSFATAANAVLPWLMKRVTWQCFYGHRSCEIHVYPECGIPDLSECIGEDKSFARAACIALIRAKRAEKGAAV